MKLFEKPMWVLPFLFLAFLVDCVLSVMEWAPPSFTAGTAYLLATSVFLCFEGAGQMKSKKNKVGWLLIGCFYIQCLPYSLGRLFHFY
jgi:hypothetical protein